MVLSIDNCDEFNPPNDEVAELKLVVKIEENLRLLLLLLVVLMVLHLPLLLVVVLMVLSLLLLVLLVVLVVYLAGRKQEDILEFNSELRCRGMDLRRISVRFSFWWWSVVSLLWILQLLLLLLVMDRRLCDNRLWNESSRRLAKVVSRVELLLLVVKE